MDQNEGKITINLACLACLILKKWDFLSNFQTLCYATVILSQSSYQNEIILHHNGATTNAFCTRLISAYFKELGITHIPILD